MSVQRKKTARSGNTQKPQHNSKQNHKHSTVNRQTSSTLQSIADAIVIKDEDLFFIAHKNGTVPIGDGHGFGLYYHDCRYLNGYEVKINNTKPRTLAASSKAGFKSTFELIPPESSDSDGNKIGKDQLGIKLERIINSDETAVYDVISFRNFSNAQVSFNVSFSFTAAFEDIFIVRGLGKETSGKLHEPSWNDDALFFQYDGEDNVKRTLTVHFSESPKSKQNSEAGFELKVEPTATARLAISLCIEEVDESKAPAPRRKPGFDIDAIEESLHKKTRSWLSNQTEIHSNSKLADKIIDRSLRDLRMLRSALSGSEFFSAGTPWYATLFGRDSITASLQTLAFEPKVAEQTLRLLARYQGTQTDEWREEGPGKILHEFRIDELTNVGALPYSPYYGSVDSTPLFLILLAEHAKWTGDLTLFNELRANVENALKWIADSTKRDESGYLRYGSSGESQLTNQGWKDSGDAIVNENGTLATPPIALAEVQGYVYMAKMSVANLFRRAGDEDRGNELEKEANDLKGRFNRDFWLSDKEYYALALQAENKPAAVLSSNAGQVLWSGIGDVDKAAKIVEKMMAEDMYNGWGIRTLSERERRYNPIGYHLGTVWPHDNSLIAAGFKRYGFNKEACQIFESISDAALHFANYRLPEVFAGFSRDDYGRPVHYPVACHPQAWAAGSMPSMLTTLLGLVPDAFENRLKIIDPILPYPVNHLEIRRLRIGKAKVDLRFDRTSDNGTEFEILSTEGDLAVELRENPQKTNSGSDDPRAEGNNDEHT